MTEEIAILEGNVAFKRAQIRNGLTMLISECYSKELSICSKHAIFQPQKFLNKLFTNYIVEPLEVTK